jgi:ankyrin repeat protein
MFIRGFTPVFFAIKEGNLDALEKIISARPEVLEHKDKNGLTPVFYAIKEGNLDALEKIISARPEVLEQKDQKGDNPILNILDLYTYSDSDQNKNILKLIFEKQFGVALQDEEIKNLVEFVGNYKFLKLFYDESCRGIYDKEFKSIALSILPSEEELESGLSKKLLKIYKTIAESKGEPFIIESHEANGDKTKLHIHYSKLNKHSSYFIFHVNAQNKLTKISYCDGNEAFSERIISKQIGVNQSTYINGATTFEIKDSIDFSSQFAEDFVKKESKGKDIAKFYLERFSWKNLFNSKVFEYKFSKMIHSIPTKTQIRRNCTPKSFNILARFLLSDQEREKPFTYSRVSGQGEKGYESYKELRQKMVDKAGEKLSENFKNLEKNFRDEKLKRDFLDGMGFFETMNHLLDKSLKKEKEAKPKSTTKLQTATDLIAQINREKFFNDTKINALNPNDYQEFFCSIAISHLNLNQEDVSKIKFLFEKQEVKIDDFLDWDFQSTQAKNNFIKLVFEHGDEGWKESFNAQFSASNPEKRNKFFKDLNKENLSLIISEFEKRKSQFGNLEQIIEVLKIKQREDSYGHEAQAIQVDFESIRRDKRPQEQAEEVVPSERNVRTKIGSSSRQDSSGLLLSGSSHGL